MRLYVCVYAYSYELTIEVSICPRRGLGVSMWRYVTLWTLRYIVRCVYIFPYESGLDDMDVYTCVEVCVHVTVGISMQRCMRP